ncbi:hypothetical protein P5V15_007469 [Pogonomyrmex californicus]
MGNTNSTQPPKAQKDRKKESSNADTGKARQPATGNKISTQTSQDKHVVRPRTTNPFIIFFLQLRSKKPNEHATVIARAAGKLWSQMTPEQKKKYVDLANAEKKRRQEKKWKRNRLSARSRMK